MRVVQLGFVSAMLVGCDVFFPLQDPSATDASLPPCEHGAPFSAGEPVSLQTNESVEAARFVPDRSLVYLSLCGPDKSTCELYQGIRIDDTNEYGTFAKLEISVTGEYDSYPTITPGGGYIVFGSERGSLVGVYIGEEVNGRFTNAQRIDVAGEAFANEPYLLGNGTTLYVSAGTDQSNSELYRSAGPAPVFPAFEKVAGVNTSDAEFAPVATDDELEIFFASNRDTPGLPLGLDIFTATRDMPTAAFGAPVAITAISSTTSTDWPLWISADHCDLYYINKTGDQATLFVTSRR